MNHICLYVVSDDTVRETANRFASKDYTTNPTSRNKSEGNTCEVISSTIASFAINAYWALSS